MSTKEKRLHPNLQKGNTPQKDTTKVISHN
jgi:hypothetical protein